MKTTIRTPKKNPFSITHRSLNRLFPVVTLLLVAITGCVDDSSLKPDLGLNTSKDSMINIDYPTEYDPDNPQFLTADDIAKGTKPVSITYPDSTTTPLTVYFNGQDVSNCYNFSATEATAELFCMRDYKREEHNTISVGLPADYQPVLRNFYVSTQGPEPVISNVCYKANPDCSLSDTGNVEITVKYSDLHPIESTTINDMTPVSEDGTTRTFLIPVSDTYTFKSTDNMNPTSTYVYKADGQYINELANIRITDDMLAQFLPLINENLSGMVAGEPVPAKDAPPVLKDITIDIIGIRLAADIKYIKVGKMTINTLAIADEAPFPLVTDLTLKPLTEEGTNWVPGDGIVDPEVVGVELLMHLRDYTECWDNFTCGWMGALKEAIPCPIKGWGRCNYGITINMDTRIYIESMNVVSAIDMKVDKSKFDIKLNPHNGEKVIQMDDVLLSMDGTQISPGPQEQGVLDNLISAPAFSDLIKDIVEDTINRNMDELKLDETIPLNTGAEMGISGRVEDLRIGDGIDGQPGSLYISLSGKTTTVTPDRTVAPALGSLYINDNPLPTEADSDSALAAVINSNAINQTLLTLYNTGITHIKLGNEELKAAGLNLADILGQDFDIRIELIPSSPGQFTLSGETGTQAWISYNKAEMRIAYNMNSGWQDLTRINVDIKAGVNIVVEDGLVNLSIAGLPKYTINHFDDLTINLDDFSFSLPGQTITTLIDDIIRWGLPQIAALEYSIDVSKLGISDKLYTKAVKNNQGHLEFETAVK